MRGPARADHSVGIRRTLPLTRARGRVVTRDQMLAKIWKTSSAGSNKVDAVVRSLRKKKLGALAPSIETVTGHGYRFNGSKRRTPSKGKPNGAAVLATLHPRRSTLAQAQSVRRIRSETAARRLR